MDQTIFIKDKIEQLLEAGNIKTSVGIMQLSDDSFSASIRIDEEAGQFIGKGGENLEAFEHVIRLVVNKGIERPVRIFVDINNYKERRAAVLRERAREIADEVRISGRVETLEPMSPFERRIIHLELAGRGDIITESVGERDERRVVIKPA